MYFDKGNFYDFTSLGKFVWSIDFLSSEIIYMLMLVIHLILVRELDVPLPGDVYERKIYPFEFSTVEMPYETYNGMNVRLR